MKVFVLSVGDEITAIFENNKPTFDQFIDHIVGLNSKESEVVKSIPDLENYPVKLSIDGFHGDQEETTLLKAYEALLENWSVYIWCEGWDLNYFITEMETIG